MGYRMGYRMGVTTVIGRVTHFDAESGVGTIEPDDQSLPDVPLTTAALRARGIDIPKLGARVVCLVFPSALGPQVLRVLAVNDPR